MPTLVTRGAASVRGFGFAGTSPVITNPYFNYTTLLLHGNGTNGAQNNTFLDSSSNNFTITRNGDTTQGTFSPFSQTGWSNYFDGSGDYLSVADSTALNVSTGDFTLECWAFPTSSSTYQTIFAKGGVAGSDVQGISLSIASGTFVGLCRGSGAQAAITSSAFSISTWNHLVLVRSGTTLALFVNGIRAGTQTNSNDASNTRIVSIGTAYDASLPFTGYVSNARIVKGTAVYDPTQTTITVPTAPFTAITNTSLLTCQSNRFIDNSSNQFTITVNGDTSVQAFSPFNPTAAYSAATVGGSGYFDGSGDYLSVADNVALQLGSGDFCIEWWMYPTGTNSGPVMWGEGSGGGGNYFNIHYNISSSGTIRVYIDSFSASYVMESSVLNTNAWTHVAVTRSGSTFRLFINGTQSATYTNAGSVNSGPLNIGSSNYSGYISDSRTVKGSAVYTSAFTPPTAPLTAITNTSLLLNFTNAGIIDNTAKNDLQTVGNAQISTSVSKFGGGSMYFDGTGDYLLAPSTPNFAFGTGDFTVEMWLYPTASFGSGGVNIVGINSSGGGLFVGGTNKIAWNLFGTGDLVAFSSFTSSYNNVWTHVAYTRSGTTGRLFINGTQQASGTDSTNYTVTTNFAIGAANNGNQPYTGYIDDLRITKGIARYTSNFTPQTSQWQDQ